MDTTNFIKLFSLIVIVSLDHTICKDNVLVKSCPEDKANWDTAARRKECKPEGGRNYVYHCLKNEDQLLVETCLVSQWIEIGVCPVLFSGGNFGFENCTLIMLRTGGACPKTAYRSNELYSFPICFDINQPKATTTQLNTTIETTTVSVTPDSPGDDKTKINTTAEIPPLDNAECNCTSSLRIGVAAGVIVAQLPLIIFWVCLRHKRRQGKGTDIEQRQERLDEEEQFLPNQQSTGPSEKRIVQLAAFAEGLHILKEHGILIITGQIGSGKTTAMENIVKLLQQEDTEWKVKDISFLTLGKIKSSNDKLIITCDNCFGKFVTTPAKKKKTMDMFTEISKWVAESDGKRKCIITMRENEFLSFNVCDSDLFRTNDKATCNKVCLDKLSEREKKSLLGISMDSFDKSSNIQKTDIINKLMCETESVTFSLLGWPLICRLATIPYIVKNINSFKKDPVKCVMSLFDTMQSANQQLYCAMIFVLFKRGNTNIYRIDSAFWREVHETLAPPKDKENFMGSGKSDSTDDQVKALSSKLNTIFLTYPHYFVYKDQDCFEFHHEIFILWLLFHFYKKFPEMIIEHFEFDVLTELLRPINYTVEVNERDFEMLCNFDDKDVVPKKHAVVEKHDNPGELVGDGNKKPVQCEEDIKEIVHFETGIQTLSNDTLKQTEEGKSENQSWTFTLEEKMFRCFIKRVFKETEKVQKLQVEKEQTYGMLEGHPLLEDKTFMRIYEQEKAITSVQGSSKGKS